MNAAAWFDVLDSVPCMQDHQNVTRNPQDPITGAHECVLWHGDIMVNQHLELQAAMCIVHKAGDDEIPRTHRMSG